MPVTGLEICTDAAADLGVVDAGETLSTADADVLLRLLNRRLDSLNAERQGVYAEVFSTHPLVPSTNPHLIGPTGTVGWIVPQRPVTIDGAGWETSPGSGLFTPLALRDALWEATPSLPSSLFYNPTWPNGELYFWPEPSGAAAVTLMTRTVLTAITLASVFSLPQGYQEMLTLDLTEAAAAAFGTQPKPSTIMLAQKARARVFANNRRSVPIRTADAGMPGGGGGWYDYRTGY